MARLAGLLDTNVLLRLLLNDVPEQHKAVVQLFLGTDAQFAVADIAIIEIIFVLCGADYNFSRTEAAKVINNLMQLPQINCNRNLFSQALSLFVDHPKLSFEDCCLAVYAQLNDATPLWTFDQKLANQADSAKLATVF